MPAQQQQSGFALLLFMIVMIGFITAGFSGLLTSSVKQQNEQARINTRQALLQAKEALLSYAVDYRVEDKGPGGGPDGNIDFYRMGKLPCPDVNNAVGGPNDIEGYQDLNCGAISVNTIGFFPFKSVGLGKIEDANGECLWYVVSGDYKNSPAANMLNWDSVGYLNIVDENGNLKHGSSEDEFPIALIISPGKALSGQDRTPDSSIPAPLSKCHANFTVTNYLEGGVNIDYSTDHPTTADTLWSFLSTSESSYLDSPDHNDQIIPIYRSELWDRVAKMKDLEFDNSAGQPASSAIEKLTKSLAECIAAYGNLEVKRRLPYPAPLDLADYRVNANYNDDNSIRYGRFPQVVDSSVITASKFVLDTSANSYCESAAGVTAYDELLWKKWKDHFFYWVSKDFDSATTTNADANKCNANGCFTVDSNSDKLAAMVVFAGDIESGQSRIWWWDESTSSEQPDQKLNVTEYLEGSIQTQYTGLAAQNYDLLNDTPPNMTDYAYCIQYDNTTFLLSAIKCTDL